MMSTGEEMEDELEDYNFSQGENMPMNTNGSINIRIGKESFIEKRAQELLNL